MRNNISVVINSLNEAEILARALKSVSWASELIVCDMECEDNTKEIAIKFGARVYQHKRVSFVEPVRNFVISKAKGDWILVLDPDEEISKELAERLQQIATKMKEIDFVRIPRKNLLFGKWMKATGWWPDYNVRFFKKGKVTWSNEIHRPPQTLGIGIDLEAEENWAIIHHHYKDISQYLERMVRYTNVQAEQLYENDYKFEWKDLIKKPLSEFLGRFFANKGYQDGVHGLALSLLQAFSFLIIYIRIWEKEKHKPEEINLGELNDLSSQAGREIRYWLKFSNLSKNPFKKLIEKIRN